MCERFVSYLLSLSLLTLLPESVVSRPTYYTLCSYSNSHSLSHALTYWKYVDQCNELSYYFFLGGGAPSSLKFLPGVGLGGGGGGSGQPANRSGYTLSDFSEVYVWIKYIVYTLHQDQVWSEDYARQIDFWYNSKWRPSGHLGCEHTWSNNLVQRESVGGPTCIPIYFLFDLKNGDMAAI